MKRFASVFVLLACALLLWAALPATDAFTAADWTHLHDHSASWTDNTGGSFTIFFNTLTPSMGAGVTGFAHWNADAFADNQYSQAKIIIRGTGTHRIGVAVRVAASASTGYSVAGDATAGTVILFKYIAGVETTLHTETCTLAVNDVLRLEAVGTTLTVKINGASVFTEVDSDITSGSAGVYGLRGGWDQAAIDDWEGGNITSASAARRRILQ